MHGFLPHHRSCLRKMAGDGSMLVGFLLLLATTILISLAVPWH
jgi:hypothetical protein